MSITILLPLFICLAGLLTYALSTNAKVQELGRIAYACGLLITTWELATRVLRL